LASLHTNEPTILSHISHTNHSSAKDHKCYEVLLTKRRANKNKQQRMDMMTNIINTRSESYIPPSMVLSLEFLHWHCKTTAFAEKPRAWSMGQLAESIYDLDTILKRLVFVSSHLKRNQNMSSLSSMNLLKQSLKRPRL